MTNFVFKKRCANRMGWYRRKQNDKTMGFGVSLTPTIPLHRRRGGEIKKKKKGVGGAQLQASSPSSSSHTNNNTRKYIHHCGGYRYF